MIAWQYRQLDLNSLPRNASEIDILNRAGEEGWELVTITQTNLAIMKRQETAQVAERNVAILRRTKERT